MLQRFDSKIFVKVKAEMEEGYKQLRNPIDTVFSSILDLGFSSVRYWMIAHQDYKDGLSILGMMLGDYKLLYAQKKLELAIKKFDNEEDRLVKARDSRATLSLITQIIRDLVSAEYATTFDYNWYDGKLISVSEQSAYEKIPLNKITQKLSTTINS